VSNLNIEKKILQQICGSDISDLFFYNKKTATLSSHCFIRKIWPLYLCGYLLVVLMLTLLPEAVWNSVASDQPGRQIFARFCTLVSFCELVWLTTPWFLNCFFFFSWTYTLRNKSTYSWRGSSSRADIWLIDLLERWHPTTVPCWKSLSFSKRQFYCHCLSMEIAWQCALFLYTC
jgi:hypothetical protein